MMSLKCHDEIVRVERVGRGCFEDAGDFQTISTCRDGVASLTCPQQVVRVGLVELGERHDKRTC